MALETYLPLEYRPKTEGHIQQNWFRADRNGQNLFDTLSQLFSALVDEGEADQDIDAAEIVYVASAGHIDLAIATSEAASDVVGAALADISSGAVGEFQTHGVIPGFTGLTEGTLYFLSASTAGAITATAPSSVGEYVVPLGVAVSATELLFRPEVGILL